MFPPIICSTKLRADVVVWSSGSQSVILLELTCCAEEGIQGAQVRKEERYCDLMQQISEEKWTPALLTLEVGARGLVGSKTFHAFHKIGFSSRQAKNLCKSLTEIVARCSYAIYLAHASNAWPHNNDLVLGKNSPPVMKDVDVAAHETKNEAKVEPNIQKLRNEGIKVLYHFTDESNIESIRENGLMSASNLLDHAIDSKMNSDALSRSLDGSMYACLFALITL